MNPRSNALPCLALSLASVAWAGPGHDHDAAPAALPPAAPRFVAASELFELVGELDGKTLTLYLDRAASNEPVRQAELDLELGGRTLRAKAQADGRFVVELPAPPGVGVHALTATVSAGEDSDLLAGELDVHGPAAALAAPSTWRGRWPWAAGAAALLGLSAWIWRRHRAAARFGSAA